MDFVINISQNALRKVNAMRTRAGLTRVTEEQLRRLLDWTDLPRSANLTAACLPRFSEVLGYRVTNNPDGGMVYACVASAGGARELGLIIDGQPFYSETTGGLAPRDYVGHTVLLPDDVVRLASQASRAVADVWYNRPA
jgi:hypothetical protein